MQNPAPQSRHDFLTRLLHWLIAVLLVAVFALGLWLADLGLFDSRQAGVGLWHKSLGALVGVLMLLRLLWRWRQPALPAIGSRLEQRLARLVQGGLYVLVVLAACSGYLLATGSGRALEWFGVLHVPSLFSLGSGMLDQVKQVHEAAAWLLVALTVLHVLAVCKHQLLDGDPVLRRMLGKK